MFSRSLFTANLVAAGIRVDGFANRRDVRLRIKRVHHCRGFLIICLCFFTIDGSDLPTLAIVGVKLPFQAFDESTGKLNWVVSRQTGDQSQLGDCGLLCTSCPSTPLLHMRSWWLPLWVSCRNPRALLKPKAHWSKSTCSMSADSRNIWPSPEDSKPWNLSGSPK